MEGTLCYLQTKTTKYKVDKMFVIKWLKNFGASDYSILLSCIQICCAQIFFSTDWLTKRKPKQLKSKCGPKQSHFESVNTLCHWLEFFSYFLVKIFSMKFTKIFSCGFDKWTKKQNNDNDKKLLNRKKQNSIWFSHFAAL